MSFFVSKILWIFFSPGNFLVLMLLLGAFLAVAQGDKARVAGRRICFSVALLFFLVAILPIGEWMLVPLENRFPAAKPDHVDGILLVGEDENTEVAAARAQPASSFAADDYIVFAALVHQYPQAKLVYTGGYGVITPDSDLTNASVAHQAFQDMGLPVDRITFENKSRTTHENAIETSALIHPTKQQKWLLVTSAQHMTRAIATFRHAGWNVFPAPASYITDGTFSTRLRFALGVHLLEMTTAVHEYVGLVAYRLQGYTDEIWPK